MRTTHVLQVLLVPLMLLGAMSGCTLNYTLEEPELSGMRYAQEDLEAKTLVVVDARQGDDLHFVVGRIGVGATLGDISGLLRFDNIDDPIAYLATHLERELKSRGVPLSCRVGEEGQADAVLTVERYQIVNFRATGFSPWEAGHVFAGRLRVDGAEYRIRAYMYNGKTPVWSMDEIQGPCFELPRTILLGDVASKINRHLYGGRIADVQVEHLVEQIDATLSSQPEIGPIDQVMELGYGNNTLALPKLMAYAKQGDDLFRSCAISAIGLLATAEELPFLENVYRTAIYNEKYMAVKAVGDIGGPTAQALLQGASQDDLYASEGGLQTVVDLYLQ
jgi:hypothetical protein